MPRPALTDDQRRETRRAIRRAAARLYAQSGLSDISARAIAQEAGVSVGTLYSYFGNLTELMQSLWKEPVSRFIGELETVLAATPDSAEQLRVLLTRYVDFALTQQSVYRGAFLFVRPESHETPDKARLREDRFFSLFVSVIEEGQRQETIRSGDPELLAQTVWASLHGAIALPQNIDRLDLATPEVLAHQAVAMVTQWLSLTPSNPD